MKLDLQSSIGVPSVIAEIQTVNADVALMQRTIADALNYRATVFAGAIGMMARDYAGGPKQSEMEELRRIQATGGHVFLNYVTEGDGLRKAAAQRIPVYEVAGSNAEKQSSQFRELTREFLATCP